MKVWINQEACLGDETCVAICPQVFEMQGDVAGVKVKKIPTELQEACQEAAESCPVQAITIFVSQITPAPDSLSAAEAD